MQLQGVSMIMTQVVPVSTIMGRRPNGFLGLSLNDIVLFYS